MKSLPLSPVVLSALCFLELSPAHAQTPSAIEQSEAVKRRREFEQLLEDTRQREGNVPELFAAETKDVGPQSILKMKPVRQYVEATVDSEFFYTSNMFLEEDGNGADPTETSVFVNTAQIALAPTAYSLGPGRLAPRLGFRYQWFNYGLEDNSKDLGRFDFDSQTVFTDLRYILKKGWSVQVGFDWARLLGHEPSYSAYSEIYKEYLPSWGLERQFAWSETKVFTVLYQGNFHFSETPGSSDEGINDRTDQALLFSYIHALTPRVVAQPYYRFQYTHYTDAGGRNDFLHTLGFSLGYSFTDQISLRAVATYDLRDSDEPLTADYRKLDAGLGLNLTFRF